MTSTGKYRLSSETMRLPEILWLGVLEVPWHQREFDWWKAWVRSIAEFCGGAKSSDSATKWENGD